MSDKKRTVQIALTIAFLCLAGWVGSTAAQTPTASDVGAAETDAFLTRWNEQRNQGFLSAALWTMIHNYRDLRQADAVLTGMHPYLQALDDYQNGNPATWSRLGGTRGFKSTVAKWLNSPETSIRAFAAIVLGVSGDRAYAQQVAKLMRNPIKTADDEEPIDRGRAAQALGMMGATEYQTQLADFLNSANQFDRVGAIYGFGYLKAKDQELAIGRLLYDKNEAVRTAAEESLGWMDEPQTAQ